MMQTKEVEMQKLDLTRRVEELKKFCEDTENGFKDNQAALEKKNAEVLFHASLRLPVISPQLAFFICWSLVHRTPLFSGTSKFEKNQRCSEG